MWPELADAGELSGDRQNSFAYRRFRRRYQTKQGLQIAEGLAQFIQFLSLSAMLTEVSVQTDYSSRFRRSALGINVITAPNSPTLAAAMDAGCGPSG